MKINIKYRKAEIAESNHSDSFPYSLTEDQVNEYESFSDSCDYNLLCNWLSSLFKSKEDLTKEEIKEYNSKRDEILAKYSLGAETLSVDSEDEVNK